LLTYKQKGNLPPIVLGINYNNEDWELGPPPSETFGTPQQQFYNWTGGGAQFSISPHVSAVTLQKVYNQGQNGQYSITETGLADASGAVHLMAKTSTGQLRTVDASGYAASNSYAIDSNGFGYRSVSSTDAKGNFIQISENYSDTAGNAIKFVRDPVTHLVTGYIDSVGRALPVSIAPMYLDPSQPDSCQLLQYPGPPGSPTVTLNFCYSGYGIQTPFSFPYNGHTITYPPSPATYVALHTVTLPNGTSWSFQYDAYGDLQTLTYPTGATVTYVWDQVGAPLRRVLSRTVNTGKRSDTWNYNYQTTGSLLNLVFTTTETDPLNNQIVHTFNGPNFGGPETSTEYIDAKAGSVSKTAYKYSSLQLVSGQNYPGIGTEVGISTVPYNQVRRKATTTLANGLTKQTCFIYDNDTDTTCSGDQYQPYSGGLMFYDDTATQFPPPQPPPPGYTPPTATPYPLVLGKLLYQYESDWGQGAPGPYIRKTITHYKWQDDAGYLAANLINIPASVCVPLPGASTCTPSSADTASYTSYAYDENNGSPQGLFGNRTSATVWTGSGPSLTTSTVFNANGLPQNVTDSAGRTATMTYDASGAYPSSVTAPATNGVSHSTSSTYDDASGVLVSTTDENGGATSYVYDAMSRAKTITSPTGTTTYNYSDVSASNPLPSYASSQSIDGSRNLTRQVNLDGLGRPVTGILTSDPDGATSTDTVYDALGRVSSVSNPHRSTSSPTDGTTTYSYDVLGRTIGTTLPDGNTRSSSYAGNVTTQTDETGSQWQQMTDGFGRLTQVMEPDPATGKPAYETDYSYDLLGNLIHSDQWGGARGNVGDRVRSFTYDGLSRLLTANLPESGNTTYSYLAYGSNTALCSGSASDVCSRTDARGAITAYAYDELGRVTSTTYPNNDGTTPNSTFAYDVPKSGWNFSNQTTPAGQPVGQGNLKGRLSWEQNANATIVYSYDAGGRTTLKSVCTPVNCGAGDHYDIDRVYDNLGDVTFSDIGRDALLNAANPNAGYYGGLNMSYSTAGRLQSGTGDIVDATHPSSIVLFTHYDPLGNPAAASYGGVLDVAKTYTQRSALGDELTNAPAYNTTRTDHFDYYPNGTTKDVKDSLYGGTTFTYNFDKLNRLASYSGPLASVNYAYDPWGNRTGVKPVAGSGPSSTYFINERNFIIGLGNDGSTGNLFSDGESQFGYDFEQRMVRANGVSFLYDPEGKRVARVVGGAIQTQYLYDPDGTLVAQLGADGKLVRGSQYGRGEHLADYTAGTGTGGGDTQLRTSDPVGTLSMKYDHAGNSIESCTATPFGDGMICQGPGDVYTGETHFADALREAEGKLDHFGARDYNSDLGRFNVPDFGDGSAPIPYADLGNPQSLNLYSYALNNPLDNVDPDGHAPCSGSPVNADFTPQASTSSPCIVENVTVHASVDDSLALRVGAEVSQGVQQGFQQAFNYYTAPRTPGCVGGYALAGAGAGALGGGALGLAGGPLAEITVPVGAFLGSGIGALEGGAAGLSACMTGGSGGGGGEGNGSNARLTNPQQRQTAKHLGLKEFKGIRSQGQSVFEKNGRYFSFSNTKHIAGEVFKEVDRAGNRIATTDLNFNRIGP